MSNRAHLPLLILAASGLVILFAAGSRGEEASPFAPSNLATTSGAEADPDAFFESADCGDCHVDQYKDWKGSLHSRAHHDGIYLAFAEMARKEGGDGLYKFCSSCHAPAAVATGEIPDGKASFLTDEGVSCEVCHRVAEMRVHHAGAGSNASVVLDDGEVRYGPLKDPSPNQGHESAYSELHTKSEFCSNCHSLIHPHNGLVIENTYEEWKHSPYAEAGIQCQDCHMRTVEQAREVARTMKPLKVPGKTHVDAAEPRDNVYAHLFTGGNVNAKLTGSSERHADEAEQRLKSAATIALELPENAAPGGETTLVVSVTNVGAGHSIPTSITELRQVWIDLSVTDAAGREVYRSGAVAPNGRVDPQAVMYNAVLLDEKGEVTYLPWRAVKMKSEKLIAAKQTVRESYAITLPTDAKGPFEVRAVLRYRSAPQEVMDEIFGKGKYPLKIVDMAVIEAELR